jgi:outer membrane protein insertion porin family
MRRAAIVAGLAVLASVHPASADVADFIGKPLADVRVELAGQPFTEQSVLELIQTRVGELLRLEAIRESVDHLVNLGRFEDIQVYAEPSADRPGAVALRWVLAPVQRVAKVVFDGEVPSGDAALRESIVDRVGSRPSVSRVPDVVEAVRAFYADRGFRAARVEPRLVSGEVPELVTLALSIERGVRSRLADVRVEGNPPIPTAQLLARLRLQHGDPYDGPAMRARLQRYEEELRELGHYEASVTADVVPGANEAATSVILIVEPGPRVRVEFAGDPLPSNRQNTLVPIRQERSVDLDLLEDASRNIEAFLRQQGYRAAQAPYVREQRGGEMIVRFTVARGPLHTLSSVAAAGNEALTTAELAPLLQLKPGEPFVDARVATVASGITELYRVRGFARASVRPDVQPGAATVDPLPVTVRLVIDEGPQTVVGAVSILGTNGVAEARLAALLTLTAGKPFYRPQLDSDRLAIERLYRNEGYLDSRIAPDATLGDDGRRIDVRWEVREGQQTTIDHVLVTGNVRTSADVIRRELTLQPGQPLGDDALAESQRRLAALGLFRRVRIVQVAHGTHGRHDVLVEVEEAPSTTISEGGGIEVARRLRPAADGNAEAQIEVAPRGFFEISRRNLWGKNRSISLFTRVSFRPRDPGVDSTDPTDEGGYGFNEYRVIGTFREPRPFDASGEAQVIGFLEQAVRSSFNFRRRGARVEYARRAGEWLTVSGRYAFDHTTLFDQQIAPEDQLLVDRLFPQVRLSTFTGSLLRDARNDVIDPQRGAVTGVDVSVSPRFAGSEVGFVRTFLQGMIYRQLRGAPRFVVAAAARVGLAVGFARVVPQVGENGQPVIGPDGEPLSIVVKDLPASERFFAGGATTVRGFVLDQLGAEGTLNDEGFPTGGNGMVVLNLELRAPYWKGLGTVVFTDVGNVFRRVSDIRVAELRPTAGFGIRYRSPLGPLRFDLGFNLDPQTLRGGGRERTAVFHISLGQAF